MIKEGEYFPERQKDPTLSAISRKVGNELDWYYRILSTDDWTIASGTLNGLYKIRTEDDGRFEEPITRLTYAFDKVAAIYPILTLSNTLPEVNQALHAHFSHVLRPRSKKLLRILTLAQAWDEMALQRLGQEGKTIAKSNLNWQEQGQQFDQLVRKAVTTAISPERLGDIAENFSHAFAGGIPRFLSLRDLTQKLLSDDPSQQISLALPDSDYHLAVRIKNGEIAMNENIRVWGRRMSALEDALRRREQFENQNPEKTRVEKFAKALASMANR